ncbi:hypothetical protein HAX54_041204 [Datura stramonium]|uniref:Uncharacterized protein n=1 Tax=Datura stramonium TaxID=4076 RepID=A0ABS8VSY0_DATST|nr:hypothetical protein [Datura stramonium]
MEVMREQLSGQGGALKRMSAKLTEIMAETTTCNNFQVTVLANTQEEPHVEGRIELRQEMYQFGSSIHDLQDVDVEEVDKSEDVKHNAVLELRRIGPHSKHLSTLCLGGNLEIEPYKPVEKEKGKSEYLESKLRSMV